MSSSIGAVRAQSFHDCSSKIEEEKNPLAELARECEEEAMRFSEAVREIVGKKDPEPFLFPIPPSKPGEKFIKI